MEMNVLEVGTFWRSLVLVCLLPYQVCRPSVRTLHVAVYERKNGRHNFPNILEEGYRCVFSFDTDRHCPCQHLQSSECPAGDVGGTISSDNRSSLEHKLIWKLLVKWVLCIIDRPLVRSRYVQYLG